MKLETVASWQLGLLEEHYYLLAQDVGIVPMTTVKIFYTPGFIISTIFHDV